MSDRIVRVGTGVPVEQSQEGLLAGTSAPFGASAHSGNAIVPEEGIGKGGGGNEQGPAAAPLLLELTEGEARTLSWLLGAVTWTSHASVREMRETQQVQEKLAQAINVERKL